MNPTPVFYPAPGGMPFSSAVRAGGLVMLSGQIPFDGEGRPLTGPIEAQAHAVLKSIAARLEAAGSSMDDVVKANIWLRDLADFAAFNKVYAGYFKEGRYPARSLVRADLVFGVGVEIEVQAIDTGAAR